MYLHKCFMEISYDHDKRDRTLAERGLDFDDAPKLFSGLTLTVADDRWDYGEARWLTYGFLDDRAVVVVWTERDDGRRIISMRHVHAEEMKNVGLD